MTYRDDAEAATLRADALAQEKAALEARLAALQPPPAPPRARAFPGGTRTVLAVVVAVVLAGVVMVVVRRDVVRDEQLAKRFAAFIRLSECYRASLEDAIAIPRDLTDSYVRENEISLCDQAIAIGLGDETWRRALAERNAAVAALHDYYGHQDYQDDHYAGAEALWQRARAAANANHAASHAALAELVIIERAIRAAQGRTRDERWWRLELAAQLQLAHDQMLRGEPQSPIDIAGAPPEVQKVLREMRWKPEDEIFRNEALEALAHE